MGVIPDPILAWRVLSPELGSHTRCHTERRGANTPPKWHSPSEVALAKRRVEEVVVGVIVVVREAPNDRGEEVDRWGAERMFEGRRRTRSVVSAWWRGAVQRPKG